ncbi:TPA: IS3 family transposase [Corynebacterium striatum]|nr:MULTISPECIES: IS3 family transposase [Corynebacterium]HAT1152683.1 IS3 family transposase [Corynebacterium striatum]AMO89541.1 integrase core domain protein [Corynebacterium simulans]HAT1254096.1 IS3 family transposase [Corynebacterium striatum]HAT1267278.1 IS3 family transposase [Corynebacterium striatum]HAT1318655.1 IS3 family transposase [Corynebacterium striatum]
MIRFIDEHRNRFSVEFICQTLNTHREGGFLTSRGYRQSKARGLSARRLRDAVLIEHISAVHRDNYGVYGVRKMWHALRRDGIDIGREQTARLMRLAGVSGKGKGRSPITTRKPNVPDLRPDLVNREFRAPGPHRLWVADITYVRTRKGFVYTAFVTDVFSRRIVGWALSDSMRTEALPLQALNQAIVCAKETTGLIHHSDHGSQYVSIVYNERLAEHGIAASTGTVGDSYDKDRAVPGHWEGDLIIGQGGTTALVTCVERSTRYTMIRKLDVHDSATTVDKLIEMFTGKIRNITKTLAWDQGVELAQVDKLSIARGLAVYFCDPHSPWQRPTNENTNGLVRDFLPEGSDFSALTDKDVQHIQDLLNGRPRKVLNWYKPEEKIQELFK